MIILGDISEMEMWRKRAFALSSGKYLCARRPAVDDGLLYIAPPLYEDAMGRPEWSVGRYDRLVSDDDMAHIRAAMGA